MSNSISSDAFRFLDVRGAQIKVSAKNRYTISRAKLNFPETKFESYLKGLRGADPLVERLITGLLGNQNTQRVAPQPTSTLACGFIEKLEEFLEIIFDRGLPPEKKLANLISALPSATEDKKYLVETSAAAWDQYLAATLLRLLRHQVDEDAVRKLTDILRVAAAIFAVRSAQTGNLELDLSVFTTASIQISNDLIDPDSLRKEMFVERPPADKSSRTHQDTVVSRLLVLDTASKDLRNYLLNQETPTLAPPVVAPPVGGAAGTTTEVSVVASPLTVEIANSKLAQSTRTLLVNEFGAVQNASAIGNVDILNALAQISQELELVGRDLFGTANPRQIQHASAQIEVLQRELRTNGSIDDAKLSRLELLLVQPTLGDEVPSGVGVKRGVRTLGVGDLKVVKQTLARYELGEIANIENVLVGQTKERVHSVRQTTEDTLIVEQEKSASTEKDLQSTDRFELADESQSAVKEQRQNETGVTITASYGPVSISANTKFSDSSSQEQSNKVSRKFAREVISKSVEKVEQRVREQRTRKTTLSIEEVNKYSQTAANKSVVGIYRWVDKVYWAQLVVHGKRMMLEFMLPEPAAVYLHSKSIKLPDPAAVKAPEPMTIRPLDITRFNYSAYAAQYGAEVDRPPPDVQSTKFSTRAGADTEKTKIALDPDWLGVTANASFTALVYPTAALMVSIGHAHWDLQNLNWATTRLSGHSKGEIPLTVTVKDVLAYNVTGSVSSIPSDYLLDKWKLDTYKAILAAYQLRLAEHRDYLASQRRTDPVIPVNQDAVNRDIERRELQRACVEVLRENHFVGPGAIAGNPSTGWPEIKLDEADTQGRNVAFFQHSFEWEQMTYMFYPYFWGRQSEWNMLLANEGGDQLFTKFLSAGFARVVVPVKPAHESDVSFYLASGIIWSGTEPPVVGDPRYVAILDEIKESLDAPDSGKPEGEPWQVKVPTSLVILDDTGSLPSWPDALPGQGQFSPSEETCGGVPYNVAQWKDAKTVADSIRKLGYAIDATGDQAAALRAARGTIRAMQIRFNQLGTQVIINRPLMVDGKVGPCTLRALTHFDALRIAGKWPGVG